tara:strand:- start:463 stop:588 length:126 start_codon:yes stop_codon:yes gene_type:complete
MQGAEDMRVDLLLSTLIMLISKKKKINYNYLKLNNFFYLFL